MCGRYTLKTTPTELAEIFLLLHTPQWGPRFNIAPTQFVGGIRAEDGARLWTLMKWGLIPSWAKDPAIGNRLINARGETVHEKPSFRAAFKRRRCLIPVDGFYEWQRTGTRGKDKQPFHIHRVDRQPFAFAGLWETWSAPDGSEVESCTIITTEPNELLATIHDRMPVILEPEDYDLWLDTEVEAESLRELIRPCPADGFEMYAVSKDVNNARNERAGLDEPEARQQSLF
jgi:putative SOS response-associated peptidase YedK